MKYGWGHIIPIKKLFISYNYFKMTKRVLLPQPDIVDPSLRAEWSGDNLVQDSYRTAGMQM